MLIWISELSIRHGALKSAGIKASSKTSWRFAIQAFNHAPESWLPICLHIPCHLTEMKRCATGTKLPLEWPQVSSLTLFMEEASPQAMSSKDFPALKWNLGMQCKPAGPHFMLSEFHALNIFESPVFILSKVEASECISNKDGSTVDYKAPTGREFSWQSGHLQSSDTADSDL